MMRKTIVFSKIAAVLLLALPYSGNVVADTSSAGMIIPVHGEHIREFKYPAKHAHHHCHIYVEHGHVHKKCHRHSHNKERGHH